MECPTWLGSYPSLGGGAEEQRRGTDDLKKGTEMTGDRGQETVDGKCGNRWADKKGLPNSTVLVGKAASTRVISPRRGGKACPK
jgi:hypothetical protein